MNKSFFLILTWFAYGISCAVAADPEPPAITNFTSAGAQKIIQWTPYPAVKGYSILSSTNIAGPWVTNTSGTIAGYQWTGTSSVPQNFYTINISPLSSNEMLTAAVLNRLAYGPTPDELARVLTDQGAETDEIS